MSAPGSLTDAVKAGDAARVAEITAAEPALASARDASGVSALLLARYRQRPDLVELLLRAGAEVDVFAAAALGDNRRLVDLLEGDPSLATAWSADGFTPLHLAAFFSEDPETARLLLDRGADPGAVARNPMAVRPLNSAAAAGHARVVELLLDAGADVHATQAGGYTALHSAAANGDARMCRLLLARGADPGRTSDDGRSPADLAAERAHLRLAEDLRACVSGRREGL